MLNPDCVPDVAADEKTCRFLVSKSHINRQSRTVKADAFFPPPNGELSVTRLLQATDDEIWQIGKDVATARNPPRTLRGRADVAVATFLDQGLKVIADKIDGNPNHANVTQWPMDDPALQLMKAKEIAAHAQFLPPTE